MNICINKIKSAKKKKFFFLHFTNLYYGNVNTEQKKKKARQDDKQNDPTCHSPTASLQNSIFERICTIEYDNHSCTNEARPMQHIHTLQIVGWYYFQSAFYFRGGGLAIHSADIYRGYTRLSLFTGRIESELESDSRLLRIVHLRFIHWHK